MPSHSSSAGRLAATLSSLVTLGVREQSLHRCILRDVLDSHPHHFASWVWWSEGVLEDKKKAKAAEICYSWHRSGDELQGAEKESALAVHSHAYGPYSQVCKVRRSVVSSAYMHRFDQQERLLSTVAAPIMTGQKCLGVAGMDFALDTLAVNVLNGRDDTVLESMDVIAAELGAGLIILDSSAKMVAWSSSVPVMLAEYGKIMLKRGLPLPDEVCPPSDGGANRAGYEKISRHRGTTLKATRSESLKSGLSVLMLTKQETETEMPPLSEREDEVMRWLAEGKSNDEIGIILSISPHTVKNHLDRIYRKIGVDNRHAAMLAWTRSQALAGAMPPP